MQRADPATDRQSIEAQAARLLVRLSLDPSDDERDSIYRWIDESPAHAVAFARAEATWCCAERLKAGTIEDTPPLPADPFIPPPQIADAPENGISSSRLAAAAIVAFLLFMAAALVTVRTLSDVDKYTTDVGEVRDVELADGSRMHMNSGTTAEVRYTEHGRRVRILAGEASFDVAHDKARPFDVEAQSAVIRAVGTAFNVRMRQSIVELTVTQGTVQVRSGPATPHRVGAGSGAVIRPRTIALTRLGKAVIDQRMAWREQMVELDGETIEQAVAEFNRYRTQPMLIGDARVSGLRIGGRFRTTDSKEFLAALQMSLPVRAVTGEDESIMLLYRDDPGQD
ncbi:MAG: hypothetical protein DI547_04685 [Sphingobium sp.]|nr:MAG: hypothetical protein DI547_04685 [Sphingobium sp.]